MFTKALLSSVLLALSVSGAMAAPSTPARRDSPSSAHRVAPAVVPSSWQQTSPSADTSAPFTFTMSLNGADMAGLTSRMEAIAASGGKWLTEEELAKYASPSAADEAAVRSFLAKNGFPDSAQKWSKLRDSVSVDTTVGETAKLFQAQFLEYEVAGQRAARTKAYTIPAEIADSVQDAYPLSTYGSIRRASTGFTPLAEEDIPAGEAEETEALERRQSTPSSCSTNSVTPACLRAYYGTSSVSPKATSGVVDIGVMGYIDQYVSNTDLKTFNNKYRPDAAGYAIPIQLRNGATNDASNPGVEAMLDVETVVSQTYPLNSQFIAEGNSQTAGDIFLLTFNDFINNYSSSTRPKVISISYGSDEREFSSSQANSMCTAAQKLTSLGTTILVSSGDYGVSGQKGDTCPKFVPTYPSGCPYILSVGATQGFSPEVMVDTSLAGFFSGAGSSNIFATPSYQSSQVAAYKSKIPSSASGSYNPSGRFFPDTAAQGSRYVIVQNGQTGLVGGTSASCPLVASLLSLQNARRRANGQDSIGWANPALYSKSNLKDITSGGSYGCGSSTTNGFPAASGWDGSAGLGSPSYSALTAAF